MGTLLALSAALNVLLGAVFFFQVVKRATFRPGENVRPNPTFDPAFITSPPARPVEKTYPDTALQASIMDKLSSTPNLKDVAAEHVTADPYALFLTELQASMARLAEARSSTRLNVMASISTEAGLGARYVERLVYEGRRPSPEAVDKLMVLVGWDEATRAGWNVRLAPVLRRRGRPRRA